MSTPPPIPKTQPNRYRPQNHPREERDAKIQIELETLEKMSEERDLKHI
jgi:hypothetical protein